MLTPVVYSEFVLKVGESGPISRQQTFYHDAGALPINDQSIAAEFSACQNSVASYCVIGSNGVKETMYTVYVYIEF